MSTAPGKLSPAEFLAELQTNIGRLRAAGPASLSEFSFRAVSPAIDGAPLVLRASTRNADGGVKCWAADAADRAIMVAEAQFTN